MSKTQKQVKKESKRPRPTASSKPAPSAVERPPESAEDFSHVLRRLIAGRGERGDNARDT